MRDQMSHADDPRLTAFALGETEHLSARDVAEVEALLRDDPAARAYVDEMRALGGELATGFAREAGPALTDEQRAAITDPVRAATPFGATGPARGTVPGGTVPRITPSWVPAGVAAAAVAAIAFVWSANMPAAPQRERSVARAPESTAESAASQSTRTFREVPLPETDAGSLLERKRAELQNKAAEASVAELDEELREGGVLNLTPPGADGPEVDRLNDRKLPEGATASEAPAAPSIGSGGAAPTKTQSTAYVQGGGGGGGGAKIGGGGDSGGGPAIPGNTPGATRPGARKRPSTKQPFAKQPIARPPADPAAGGIGGPAIPGGGAGTIVGDRPGVGPAFNGADIGGGEAGELVAEELELRLSRQGVKVTPELRAELATLGGAVREYDELLVAQSKRVHSFGRRKATPGLPAPLVAEFVVQNHAKTLSPEALAILKSTLEIRVRRTTESPATESYDGTVDNPFLVPTTDPLSTFSIDVDTAAYANVRRFLNAGRMPPREAVRVEELINYFRYDYAQPSDDVPFSVNLEVAACPWNTRNRLVRIGLRGRAFEAETEAPGNLVFLLDVSGSMKANDKLPLLKRSMKLLVEQMREQDTVGIVVYSGASRVALESTPGSNRAAILAAIDGLSAGGSTNGGAGIQDAYAMAERHFRSEGVNRVVLATDGDFNVGVTDKGALVELVREKAQKNVFLTVLGFGTGNLKDATLEQIADKGNGSYHYVDSLREGRRVLVEDMHGTLVTIAKDVKLQVEFNPAQVASYRLVGYANRLLAARDFNDDTRDAGEIGAGHTVTAFYEVVPVGSAGGTPSVDKLKYQDEPRTKALDSEASTELLTVKLRYKQPDGTRSEKLEVALSDSGGTYGNASRDFKFAAGVAAFGMLLRNSPHRGTASYEAVLELAGEGVGDDPRGYRTEFLDLVRKAQTLTSGR